MNIRRRRRWSWGLFGLLTVMIGQLAGCQERATDPPGGPDRVERSEQPTGDADRSTAAATPGGSSGIAWAVPDGWRPDVNRRPMREATFHVPIPDADGLVEVAVSQFPGDVGGLLANVNRWRAEVELPPVGPDELESQFERFENPGLKGHLLHLQGPQRHMLAAIISEPAADRTWFVKAVCAPTTSEWLKPSVFAFARSMRVE